MIEAGFNLCDRTNPSIGYELRIRDAQTGRCILSTNVRPDTFSDLLSARDCLEVIAMYAEKGADEICAVRTCGNPVATYSDGSPSSGYCDSCETESDI